MYHRGNTAGKPDLVTELQKNGVTFDIRKLNVGDFLWVAREQVAPDPGNRETYAHSQSCTHIHFHVFLHNIYIQHEKIAVN